MDDKVLIKQQIYSLLCDMKEKLLEYERVTLEMLSCPRDHIVDCTEKRVVITKSIEKIFADTDVLCDKLEDGAEVRRIIRSVSDFTGVSQDNEEIFLKSQEIFSTFTRIKDSDIQVIDRLDLEKQILMKKIKETNSGNQAKASRFSVGTDDGGKKYFSSGSKSI